MFPRMKWVIFLCAGLITIAASLYWLFRVPENYPLWSRLELESIAVLINPNDPELFLAIGNSHFGHGGTYDIRKAEKAFGKAIELRPDFLEARYQLGRISFINGNFYKALDEMNEVLRIDPEFKKAYYMYGLINGYKGDLDEAIWGFSEFIKHDDFNWAGYNDLAWIYFKQGNYEKVREVSEKGLEKAPNNPWLNNIYGTALMNLGEKEAAKHAFLIALEESEKMTPEDWGQAYPGNNPDIYQRGLEETKSVIRHNMSLLGD